MRDAKIMQLYEGTSQIQRLVIAREVLMPRQRRGARGGRCVVRRNNVRQEWRSNDSKRDAVREAVAAGRGHRSGRRPWAPDAGSVHRRAAAAGDPSAARTAPHQRGPSYGNQLMERIGGMTAGVLSVNPNTMYPLLRRLEGAGSSRGSGSIPSGALAGTTRSRTRGARSTRGWSRRFGLSSMPSSHRSTRSCARSTAGEASERPRDAAAGAAGRAAAVDRRGALAELRGGLRAPARAHRGVARARRPDRLGVRAERARPGHGDGRGERCRPFLDAGVSRRRWRGCRRSRQWR